MRAPGIVGECAADGGPVKGGGVGGEHQSERCGGVVQRGNDDAGLYGCFAALWVEVENTVQVAVAVNDDAWTVVGGGGGDALTGQAGAGAARNEAGSVGVREVQQGGQVMVVSKLNNNIKQHQTHNKQFNKNQNAFTTNK